MAGGGFYAAAGLFVVRDEDGQSDFGVCGGVAGGLLCELSHGFVESGQVFVGELRPLFCLPFFLSQGVFVVFEGVEGAELGCPVDPGHVRMAGGDVVRQVYDIAVISRSVMISHLCFLHPYSLCPPCVSFRWRPVAPSSKLVPRTTAFLPKRFLISRTAFCIFISRSFFFFSSSLFCPTSP